jgi:hypothetical protein
MNSIQPTINLGDTGEAVANLQDALRFLLDRKAVRANDTERPTADELRDITTKSAAHR